MTGNTLEFYTMHRMTDDRHVRIYEDGEEEEIDAICYIYVFNPKTSGDQERVERENREHNQRVYLELQEKGLDMKCEHVPEFEYGAACRKVAPKSQNNRSTQTPSPTKHNYITK